MKKYSLMLCIIISILMGCGRGENYTADRTAGELTVYAAETWDAGITPNYLPQSASFFFTDDALYFIDRNDGLPGSVYRASVNNQKNIEQVLQLESGRIEAIVMAVEVTGEPVLIIAGKDADEALFIAAYSVAGQQLWKQSYGEIIPQTEENEAILCLAQDGEGCLYVISTEHLWLFDEEGRYQGGIICPGEGYLDLCTNEMGTVFVIYQEGRNRQNTLAEVQYQRQALIEESQISFYGYMWKGLGEAFLVRDSSSVYIYSPGQKTITEFLDMSEYNLTGDRLQAIHITGAGEILIASWELLNRDSPVTITRFSETVEGQTVQEDKCSIVMLVPEELLQIDQATGGSEFINSVSEFNQQSRDYNVVLEGIPMEDGVDIYSSINTRLLAKESADLIYLLEYQDVERYAAKGFLEELTPYIDNSENININEYSEAVRQCYKVNDSLYSIPVGFNIDTLVGKVSELGNEPGWAIEEFLEWLEQHPDARSQEGLSKSNVLLYCLMGGLDAYLDMENGDSSFEEGSFSELLLRINQLDLNSEEHWDDWWQIIDSGEYSVLERYDIYGFSQCSDKEEEYGEALVYKGYPTEDGSPCYLFSGSGIGILSRSANKEGAYAFWEYYLMNHSIADDSYYTNMEALKESMEYAMSMQYRYDEDGGIVIRYSSAYNTDENWLPYVSQEQCDKQLALTEYVRMDTLKNRIIRNFILEEAQYYFMGDKSLEETCRIIQGRVQLYLDETG